MSGTKKSPFFPFYPADFLADENVILMSNREVGCYVKLMCYCWREGSIPNDTSKLAKLCGEDSSAMAELWQNIWHCFAVVENRLIHPRLSEEREKQKRHSKERSKSGRKGASARWQRENTDGSAIGSATQQPMAKNGFSSSFSFSDYKRPTRRRNVDVTVSSFKEGDEKEEAGLIQEGGDHASD